MRLRKFILLIVSICFYVQTFPVLAEDCPRFAKSPILYQYRGDRCEGVLREKLVSSFNIKLLSATAYREAINSLLENLNLSFYLPNNDKKVAIRVQELEPVVFYQMDKIEPEGFWNSGRMNRYP